jgi:hypothetical protein
MTNQTECIDYLQEAIAREYAEIMKEIRLKSDSPEKQEAMAVMRNLFKAIFCTTKPTAKQLAEFMDCVDQMRIVLTNLI